MYPAHGILATVWSRRIEVLEMAYNWDGIRHKLGEIVPGASINGNLSVTCLGVSPSGPVLVQIRAGLDAHGETVTPPFPVPPS